MHTNRHMHAHTHTYTYPLTDYVEQSEQNEKCDESFTFSVPYEQHSERFLENNQNKHLISELCSIGNFVFSPERSSLNNVWKKVRNSFRQCQIQFLTKMASFAMETCLGFLSTLQAFPELIPNIARNMLATAPN